MEWMFIVAIVVMVPVLLLPVAFVWYLNIGGLMKALRKPMEKKVITPVIIG
jgi:hypothetical protein